MSKFGLTYMNTRFKYNNRRYIITVKTIYIHVANRTTSTMISSPLVVTTFMPSVVLLNWFTWNKLINVTWMGTELPW
jgi:hypothetical protein